MAQKKRGPVQRLARHWFPLTLIVLGAIGIVMGLNRPDGRSTAPQFSPTPEIIIETAIDPAVTARPGEPTLAVALMAVEPPPSQTATAAILPSSTPSPTPSATPTATVLPSATPSAEAVALSDPTKTPQAVASAQPTATSSPMASPTTSASPSPTEPPLPTNTPTPVPPTAAPPVVVSGSIGGFERFGVAVPAGNVSEAVAAGLRFGSYLNWHISSSNQGNFWQMIRLSQNGVRQSWEEIEGVIAARPGAIWLVGNEPDAPLQDNVTPERYAELYHEVYTFIKTRDPQARIAIGGVSQPTPLRLVYLERILDGYRARYGEPMPIDIWNVHAFILREEQGSWGAGIPPGVGAASGQLIEIDDHDDLDRLKQQLINFRVWMAAQGYQDRPLVISEYGILMPPDYGFDQQRVARFLQGSLDFFTTARHEAGYPADDYRLVQWWFWFGVYDVPLGFPAGNLYDPQSGSLTPAGEIFSRYPR